MYNKKVIIDAIRNLNKSKPAPKYNKNYTNNSVASKKDTDNWISAKDGVDTPIYKAVKVAPSNIEGKGLFSEEAIKKGDVIGVSHIRKSFNRNGEQMQAPFPSTVLGYYNHSESPNVYEVDNGDHILMVANRAINPGEELTSNYNDHRIEDLETPDNFKKGGSTHRPKIPNKKNSRAYSRSLEATNKLFAQHPLFAKPKSRKNKIFDPNSRYFEPGGELPKARNGLSYDQRMQAYNDSLALYNSYNQFMNVLKNPQYKLPMAAISKYQGRNQGFGPSALPGNLYQNISPVKVFTYYQGNQPWRVFKYKKPVKPNQANDFITKSKPCVPKTTVINNVPEKAPFGKKLVGTNSETVPVTGKKCEYVQTINPIYEDLITEPIKIGTFPLKVEHGKLPELQPGNYFSEPLPEAPQYALEPYTDKRLRLSIEPGKTKSKTHRGRLFDGKGQKYKWTTYEPSKDLELRRKEVVRPIPALVQKLTGYDPKYFEGYENEEGDYIPGELEIANELGNKVEFRGAASLRDFINQQKYAKEYEEYQKKLDEWDERYEQSKKKQAESIAFKYGGLSKFLEGGPQCPKDYTYNPETKRCEKKSGCPEGYYWNGEHCVPDSTTFSPIDPQYLLENPDFATHVQNEPEVSVNPMGSDFAKAKLWMNKWHDSPMHDKMLLKSLNDKKAAEKIKDLRKKNIQTSALDIDFNKTNPAVKYIEDNFGFTPGGSSDSNTGQVSIYNSYPDNSGLLIHELSHSSDRPSENNPYMPHMGRIIPEYDQGQIYSRSAKDWKDTEYGKKEIQQATEYGGRLEDEYMGEKRIPRDEYEQDEFNDYKNYLLNNQGTEIRARLNDVRYRAQKQNIYDPFNKKITRREFKNIKNSQPLNELRKLYKDRDIRWMLNNVSKNDNQTEDIGYAKQGGYLPKAQNGPPDEFYQNWFQNRMMSTPEGQKLLDKIRPEALERSRESIPYIYSEELDPNTGGYYDAEARQIILNKFLPEAQIEATKQHEKMHDIQAGDKFSNVLNKPHQYLVDQNIIDPKEINTGNPEWDKNLMQNYDDIVDPNEMHARIMTLRRLAGFKPDQVIAEKDLQDYFNKVNEAGENLDPDIEDLKGVTKGNQSIVNLLNDMVSTPAQQGDLNIAENGGPWNPDYEPPTTYEFQTMTPEQIAERDKTQRQCTEDRPCYETDQIQAYLNQGRDLPGKAVGLMWDVADDVNNPESKYFRNARAKWKSMGLSKALDQRLGLENPANCMWAAGSGWQCLSDTKDKFKKLPLTAFESNDKFINAVNKGTIPFERIAKATDKGFDAKEKGLLRTGDVINLKGPNHLSHAITFSHYREDGTPIYLDSSGHEMDFNWNAGIYRGAEPGNGRVAYVSRFSPEKYFADEIEPLEEIARTNPTYHESGGYMDIELDEADIDKYVKGGYIVEDISIPSLTMKEGGELPKAKLGRITKDVKNLGRATNIATIGTVNTLANTLAPIMIHPARIPLAGMRIEKVGPFTGSPLNILPFYGKAMEPTHGTAFRKFGDTLDYVKMSQELNPAHGPLLRMGKEQVMSEGNWAEPEEPNEAYSGVFGAQFDKRVPGSDLGFASSATRNGVLITDASGNRRLSIPISEPGLSFHRRLPFSNRYVPVNMDKLRNDEFDFTTMGGNAQGLLERYGYAAGAAALLGAMGATTPQQYLDEYVNEPLMKVYNKHIKPGILDLMDTSKYQGFQPNKKSGGSINYKKDDGGPIKRWKNKRKKLIQNTTPIAGEYLQENPEFANNQLNLSEVKVLPNEQWLKDRANIGPDKIRFFDAWNPKKWGLNDYSDYTSFNSAFRNSRASNEDQFVYKGKRFTTDLIPEAESDLYWESKDFLKNYYENEPFQKIDSWGASMAEDDYMKNKYGTTWSEVYNKQKNLSYDDPKWQEYDDIMSKLDKEMELIHMDKNEDFNSYYNNSRIKERLKDLYKPSYFSITSQKPQDMSEDGYWSPLKNKIFLTTATGKSETSENDKLNTTYIHELSHKGDDDVAVYDSYPEINVDKLNKSPWGKGMSQETFDYLNDPSEIEARKLSTLFYLYKNKRPYKSGKITSDILDGLYNDSYADKLPYDIVQLLDLYGAQQDDLLKYLNGDYSYRKKSGGAVDYKLGDEIDEATMKQLKKLGYTFEIVR